MVVMTVVVMVMTAADHEVRHAHHFAHLMPVEAVLNPLADDPLVEVEIKHVGLRGRRSGESERQDGRRRQK